MRTVLGWIVGVLGRRWVRWTLAAGAGLIVVTALTLLVFELLPDLFAPERSRGFGVAAEARARADVRTSALQLLGGLVIAIGAVLTARNVQLVQERNRIERESQITERFTRAIDQLGSEEIDIRLGGIYALERIARDSRDDHWTIMEVLTAFVREHARASDEDQPDPRVPVPAVIDLRAPAPTDVGAALTVLARRDARCDRPGGRLDLRRVVAPAVDMREAALPQGLLDHVQMRHSNLHGIQLPQGSLFRADLRGADLTDGDLRAVHMSRALLDGADLSRADLAGALIRFVRMESADLTGATLREAQVFQAYAVRTDFTEADLRGALMRSATLRQADFTAARLDRADLRRADLAGADLSTATLTGTKLRGAAFDGETRWPEGFDPLAAGARDASAAAPS